MNPEEILESSLQTHRGLRIVDLGDAVNCMEEYAKQQAIAFVKYNCPDIKLEDSLLNAGYAGFLIHQNQEQQNKQ